MNNLITPFNEWMNEWNFINMSVYWAKDISIPVFFFHWRSFKSNFINFIKPDWGRHPHVTFSDQEQACHLAFYESVWHKIVEPKTDNHTDCIKCSAVVCNFKHHWIELLFIKELRQRKFCSQTPPVVSSFVCFLLLWINYEH